MVELFKSEQRGHTQIDWLNSHHSFSFGEYYNPKNIHFGPLRVMNHDIIQPEGGFPTHPHSNMEIVTLVFEGSVAHKDSTGGEGTITVNEVQRMTAGKGILHSEFNPSETELLNLLQIWFIPNKTGLTPSYEQKKYPLDDKKNKLLKVVSGKKDENLIFINQDADIYLTDLDTSKKVDHILRKNRGAYIYIIKGNAEIDGIKLNNGDAAKILDQSNFQITALENSQIILFDLTMEF
jgi:redox-sensitive bicupin YhaK (pirin superfamily)